MIRWVVKDTLTGALERLEVSMKEWREPVKDFGEKILLPEIEELTPEEEGYLVDSARENMKVRTTLTGVGLSFRMTGEKNPERHSDFITKNGTKLDYALFQHQTYLHHPKPGATDHYLEVPVDANRDVFPYDMGEVLMEKLKSIRK